MIDDTAKSLFRDLARAIAKQTGEDITLTVAGQGWAFAVDATCIDLAPALIALEDA